MKEYFLSWGMLILSVICNAVGAFVIKMRLNELGAVQFESFMSIFRYFIELLKSPLVIFGTVLFFLAPFLFAVSLSRMEITVAYPVQVGLNFLLVLVLALIFLGEHLTPLKIVGIVFVCLGVMCLHR
ncbi:MAG: EamA family transporter [Candidatus Omnitrophica bacterium]|nr:EamA family transporter [Candidatus Omnitrophota bacterium]